MCGLKVLIIWAIIQVRISKSRKIALKQEAPLAFKNLALYTYKQ